MQLQYVMHSEGYMDHDKRSLSVFQRPWVRHESFQATVKGFCAQAILNCFANNSLISAIDQALEKESAK